MRKYFAALTVLMLAPGALAADDATKGERLVSPALNDFVTCYEAADKVISIHKEVPHGERADSWTRMVTTLQLIGYATRMTPTVYAQMMAEQLPKACPGATVTKIDKLKVSDRPASQFEVECPRGEAGLPETIILLSVAGKENMYVKQVALRGARPMIDYDWARSFLAATVFCAANDPKEACHQVRRSS